ncbi:predicted protein [Histoplasma capsulatum var. duboisii H88]|uniref:Predicted protein n=2 Tax=Ajellomyces capsulatus TaxID=5037 RepID=F0UTR1_AJEC8|nr:predicted protein [Histoplasma capsulatum H143]EGC49288.1 predicted protein [Histoplasma capsulatum var. duboisii H88]
MDRESVDSVPERAAGELWSGVPSEILALCGLVGDNHRHRHIYWRSSLAEIICPPASLDTAMSWIGETARELQSPHAPLPPWTLAGPKYSVVVLVSVTLNPDAHSPSSKWLVTSQLTTCAPIFTGRHPDKPRVGLAGGHSRAAVPNLGTKAETLARR